jgi:hypothetical protein
LFKPELLNLENLFINETFKGSPSFVFQKGTIPILISAPHSVDHIREGNIKKGEYKTGIFSHSLNKEMGTFSFYKTKNIGNDPNYDSSEPYKQELVNIVNEYSIPLVIDLHLMREDRPNLIELGTGRGENIKNNPDLALETALFFKRHLNGGVAIDELFPAVHPYTVSSYISRECSIDCLQLEINKGLILSEEGFTSFHLLFEEYILFLLTTFFSNQIKQIC